MARRLSTRRLRQRLAGRSDSGRERAMADLGAGLPPAAVSELADLLELELGVPLGLLRRDDRLDEILAPFPLGNPLTWLWAEAGLEDGIGEINHRLASHGLPDGIRLQTVRELFEVWSEPSCAGPKSDRSAD